eukprot:766772-Hanusia_phi.AAC.1
MSSWVDEIPPIKQPMRYGNKAFRSDTGLDYHGMTRCLRRDWMDKVAEEVPKLVEEMLPDEIKAAAVEATPYLLGSLGDKTRIDYGTGHEQVANPFMPVIWVLELQMMRRFVKDEDADALALNVFWEYLQLVRRLQLAYRLEPAGSHGCWSLDDYQFIPFLWGSAQVKHPAKQGRETDLLLFQLMNHPTLVPSSIHEDWVVNANANSVLTTACARCSSQRSWTSSPSCSTCCSEGFCQSQRRRSEAQANSYQKEAKHRTACNNSMKGRLCEYPWKDQVADKIMRVDRRLDKTKRKSSFHGMFRTTCSHAPVRCLISDAPET